MIENVKYYLEVLEGRREARPAMYSRDVAPLCLSLSCASVEPMAIFPVYCEGGVDSGPSAMCRSHSRKVISFPVSPSELAS